ncbi:MAG: nucleotidyl transferase AbiEii/AbiGii toxin family protein [Nitrospirota bacterium]
MRKTGNIRDNPILTEKQKILLEKFAEWPQASQFYMTGGTALSAFYLQHRLSEDVDFFTEENVEIEAVLSFLQSIPDIRDLRLERKFDRKIFLIHYGDGEDFRVEFTKYPFKRIDQFTIVEGINIDSMRDILANKLFALADRRDIKDFVDIYFILKENPAFSIDNAINKAEQKFGIKGLIYILEGRFLECPKEVELLAMRKSCDGEGMAAFFKEIARGLIRESLENDT